MKNDQFVVIDVETANPDYSSICSVGIVEFENGEIVSEWSTLVDPEEPFYKPYTDIHRIESWMVRGKPTFPQIYEEIISRVSQKILCTYSPFDKTAIRQVTEKYHLAIPEYSHLDIMRVVRRVWKEFSTSGYGLGNISKYLNIEFDHHDALEDARAAGKVLLRASGESKVSVIDWMDQQYKKNSSGFHLQIKDVQETANPAGVLYGQNLCFTGALNITRLEAAKKAAHLGCFVQSGVTKKTDILVIGSYDPRHFSTGQTVSAKQQKAEALIKNGQSIRIIGEKSFFDMVDNLGA